MKNKKDKFRKKLDYLKDLKVELSSRSLKEVFVSFIRTYKHLEL
jgi:hypothetical protein